MRLLADYTIGLVIVVSHLALIALCGEKAHQLA
jgi:hypothetical protein